MEFSKIAVLLIVLLNLEFSGAEKFAYVHHEHDFTDITDLNEHIHDLDIEQIGTEQQRLFHLFRLADRDRDRRVDGCEMSRLIIRHTEEHDDEYPVIDDIQLERQVDSALASVDLNNDGYIDIHEFRRHTSARDKVNILKAQEQAEAAVPDHPQET